MKKFFTSKITTVISVFIINVIAIAGIMPLVDSNTAYAADTVTFTEFDVPTYAGDPQGITTGPDGNLWFTEMNGHKIGRITPTGDITEFPVPTLDGAPRSDPYDITTGPDGNLWFTEMNGHKIGRITPTGDITEFPVPTPDSVPHDITAGPDGNIWFTIYQGNKIGRITPTGDITEFSVPTPDSFPTGITTGPDGNIWFTEFTTNKIGRITPTGDITEFPVPTPDSVPHGITAGPDGNIWFTEWNANKIGRITPNGAVTEFSIPTPSDGSGPYNITAGSDGNLWFAEFFVGQIGRITPTGDITEFPVPSRGPYDITAGSDGNIWFTEFLVNKIGRISLSSTTPTPTPTPKVVPLIKQDSSSWATDTYSQYGPFSDCKTPTRATIAGCGCLMTSIAMILQYHGVTKLPDGTLLDPGSFNTWLIHNGGYYRDGGVNSSVAVTVAKKAKSQNPDFAFDGLEYERVWSEDKVKLTEDLQNGLPAILEEPGHFIVATKINGDTFNINDPARTITSLADTLYDNSFITLGRIHPSHTDLSYITMAVDPDVELVLKDTNGNIVGESHLSYKIQDPANPISTNIPSLKILEFFKPSTDSYTIEVTSPNSQQYQLDIYLITQEGDAKLQTFSGQVIPGITNVFALSYNKQSTEDAVVEPSITLPTLKNDLNTLYELGFIDNQGVYTSLSSKVDYALNAFLSELDSQRGKHVTEEAYQLLKDEANFLIE